MTARSSVPSRLRSDALARGVGLLAIASLTLAVSVNAAAQEEFEELVPITPMIGLWQHEDGDTLEIAEDRLWRTVGDDRAEFSETACPLSFEYLGYSRSGADIAFPHEANQTVVADGGSVAARLRELLPEGPYLTLISACCCVGDVNRGVELIQADESTLVGVFWQEGAYELQTFTRDVAAVPSDRSQQLLGGRGTELSGLIGMWWRCSDIGVEIAADRVWHVQGDRRQEISPEVCFGEWRGREAEHTFRARMSDAILARWVGSVDPTGQPIDADLHAAIFAGTYQTLERRCDAEPSGGAWYVLGEDGTLMEIAWAEGRTRLTLLTRDRPSPSNECLYDHERRELQSGLGSLGFYSGAIDGDLGPESKTAIAAFQQSIGEEPTGVVTAEQLRALIVRP